MVIKSPLYPTVRKMLRKDVKDVTDLSKIVRSEWYWKPVEIVRFMNKKSNRGIVAEYREQIIGFSFYQFRTEKYGLQRDYCTIVDLAVHPEARRREIGSGLLEDVHAHAANKLCDYVKVYIPDESNCLGAQLFARGYGYDYIGSIDGDLALSLTLNASRFSMKDLTESTSDP